MLEDLSPLQQSPMLRSAFQQPTLAQIVVWQLRNPLHPKPEQLFVLIGSRIHSQLCRLLINAASHVGAGTANVR